MPAWGLASASRLLGPEAASLCDVATQVPSPLARLGTCSPPRQGQTSAQSLPNVTARVPPQAGFPV